MAPNHRDKVAEIDPRSVEMRFSDGVRQAFGDLAAAVHFSEHFSPEMLSTLQDWAAGKKQSVRSILIAFPLIAEETFKHIQATGDTRAQDAWSEIASELLERGFTLVQDRVKAK